jgi:hypothetical protein
MDANAVATWFPGTFARRGREVVHTRFHAISIRVAP